MTQSGDVVLNSNAFLTFLSIILSGLLSLIISRYYYKRANKDMMLRIMKPVVIAFSKDGFNGEYVSDLAELNNRVEVMYLKKNEQRIIAEMAVALGVVKRKTWENAYQNAVVRYFIERFKQEAIELKIVPVRDYNDETIDFEYVDEIGSLTLDLQRIYYEYNHGFYDAEFERLSLEDLVKNILNQYAASLSGSKNITFSDVNLSEVVSNSEAMKEYQKARIEAKDAVKNFLNLKICQEMVKENGVRP